jgi:hypothetical protein
MRLIIFKSQSNNELRAFSNDPGGRPLPSQFAPWHAIGVVAADKDPPHKMNRGVIEQAITEKGFQLFRFKLKKN